EARAAAKAPSRSTMQKALSFGCSASIRTNRISAASTGDSALRRYRSARASAEAKAMSAPLVMSPPPSNCRDYQAIATHRQRRTRGAGSVRDQEMQGLRLGGEADHRPRSSGPKVSLAIPQLAIEAQAAELACDRQPLGTAR